MEAKDATPDLEDADDVSFCKKCSYYVDQCMCPQPKYTDKRDRWVNNYQFWCVYEGHRIGVFTNKMAYDAATACYGTPDKPAICKGVATFEEAKYFMQNGTMKGYGEQAEDSLKRITPEDITSRCPENTVKKARKAVKPSKTHYKDLRSWTTPHGPPGQLVDRLIKEYNNSHPKSEEKKKDSNVTEIQPINLDEYQKDDFVVSDEESDEDFV